MLPDPGCYEERYQRGRAVLRLAASLLVVGSGLLSHRSLISVAIVAALGILVAIPAVLNPALRPVAFRADHAGITLGSDRELLHRRAVFIPWTDVEKIILYSGYTRTDMRAGYTGVQRQAGAPALPWGNQQAPGCPVPGVAAGATRRVIRWRLDRERLAAVTAAVAPGIGVIEARNGPGRRIEGPGQLQDGQPRAMWSALICQPGCGPACAARASEGWAAALTPAAAPQAPPWWEVQPDPATVPQTPPFPAKTRAEPGDLPARICSDRRTVMRTYSAGRMHRVPGFGASRCTLCVKKVVRAEGCHSARDLQTRLRIDLAIQIGRRPRGGGSPDPADDPERIGAPQAVRPGGIPASTSMRLDQRGRIFGTRKGRSLYSVSEPL